MDSYSDSPLSPQLHSLVSDLDLTHSEPEGSEVSYRVRSPRLAHRMETLLSETAREEEIDQISRVQQLNDIHRTNNATTTAASPSPFRLSKPLSHTSKSRFPNQNPSSSSSSELDQEFSSLTPLREITTTSSSELSEYHDYSSSDQHLTHDTFDDTSFTDFTSTSHDFSSPSAPAYPSDRRPYVPFTKSYVADAPALAASQRRTDFFKKGLASYAEQLRKDKRKTPLSPEEMENKQYRVKEIEKNIERLRASHAEKKSRVAVSLESVRAAYDRFRQRNKEVAKQGLSVVQAMETAQRRLQEEDLEAAAKELNSAMTLHEKELATKLQSLPAVVLGPNPQTTLRGIASSELPPSVLAQQKGGRDHLTTVAAEANTTVEIQGHQLVVHAPPSKVPKLSDLPLPPPPALLSELSTKALEALTRGDKVDRDAYALLLSASEFHDKQAQKLRHKKALHRGELGVPQDATDEQHRQWVNQNVFQAHDHAHSFPAPLVSLNNDKAKPQQTAFQALQLEKKKFSQYISVVRDAWSNEKQARRVGAIATLEAKIASATETRSKERVRFEQEKIVAMELMEKQRTLLEVKQIEREEAYARSEYRRRAENIFRLVETDGIWTSDQGKQAIDYLAQIGRLPSTSNTYWGRAGPATTAAAPIDLSQALKDPSFDLASYLRIHPPALSRVEQHHAYEEALARQQAQRKAFGWRDDLWETKEWSHRSESSMDPLSQHSGAGTLRTTRGDGPQEEEESKQQVPIVRKGAVSIEDELGDDHSAHSSPAASPRVRPTGGIHPLEAGLIRSGDMNAEERRRARRRAQAAETDAQLHAKAQRGALKEMEEKQRRLDEAQAREEEREAARQEQARLEAEAAIELRLRAERLERDAAEQAERARLRAETQRQHEEMLQRERERESLRAKQREADLALEKEREERREKERAEEKRKLAQLEAEREEQRQRELVLQREHQYQLTQAMHEAQLEQQRRVTLEKELAAREAERHALIHGDMTSASASAAASPLAAARSYPVSHAGSAAPSNAPSKPQSHRSPIRSSRSPPKVQHPLSRDHVEQIEMEPHASGSDAAASSAASSTASSRMGSPASRSGTLFTKSFNQATLQQHGVRPQQHQQVPVAVQHTDPDSDHKHVEFDVSHSHSEVGAELHMDDLLDTAPGSRRASGRSSPVRTHRSDTTAPAQGVSTHAADVVEKPSSVRSHIDSAASSAAVSPRQALKTTIGDLSGIQERSEVDFTMSSQALSMDADEMRSHEIISPSHEITSPIEEEEPGTQKSIRRPAASALSGSTFNDPSFTEDDSFSLSQSKEGGLSFNSPSSKTDPTVSSSFSLSRAVNESSMAHSLSLSPAQGKQATAANTAQDVVKLRSVDHPVVTSSGTTQSLTSEQQSAIQMAAYRTAREPISPFRTGLSRDQTSTSAMGAAAKVAAGGYVPTVPLSTVAETPASRPPIDLHPAVTPVVSPVTSEANSRVSTARHAVVEPTVEMAPVSTRSWGSESVIDSPRAPVSAVSSARSTSSQYAAHAAEIGQASTSPPRATALLAPAAASMPTTTKPATVRKQPLQLSTTSTSVSSSAGSSAATSPTASMLRNPISGSSSTSTSSASAAATKPKANASRALSKALRLDEEDEDDSPSESAPLLKSASAAPATTSAALPASSFTSTAATSSRAPLHSSSEMATDTSLQFSGVDPGEDEFAELFSSVSNFGDVTDREERQRQAQRQQQQQASTSSSLPRITSPQEPLSGGAAPAAFEVFHQSSAKSESPGPEPEEEVVDPYDESTDSPDEQAFQVTIGGSGFFRDTRKKGTKSSIRF